MTLTKMSPSGWRYYAEEVSSGREDYYAVSSETLGRFVGRGAVAFGLAESEVSPIALERLFGAGADPRTAEALGRGFASDKAGVVAGFPMSFSPPLCRVRHNGGRLCRIGDYAEQTPSRSHQRSSEGYDG
jgi:hypothetical protein